MTHSRSPRALPAGLPLLLAFDLYGTLIPELATTVPETSVQALARLRALGVKVAVITGRDTLPRAVMQAAQPDAVSTNNGGRIELHGELHTEARFSAEDLEAVLAHELHDSGGAVHPRRPVRGPAGRRAA